MSTVNAFVTQNASSVAVDKDVAARFCGSVKKEIQMSSVQRSSVVHLQMGQCLEPSTGPTQITHICANQPKIVARTAGLQAVIAEQIFLDLPRLH